LNEVKLQTKDSWTIERMVLKSEVEIGLVTMSPRSSLLVAEPFSEEEIVAFVSIRHRLAKKSQLTLEELARAKLIVREEERVRGSTEPILRKLRRQGFKPNVSMRCQSPMAVQSIVEAGAGVGLLARANVAPALKEGKIKILRVPELGIRLSRFIIYRKDRPLSSEAQDFLTLLRASRPPQVDGEPNQRGADASWRRFTTSSSTIS
jgi:DNA-binding transcriptional LysR family regulator